MNTIINLFTLLLFINYIYGFLIYVEKPKSLEIMLEQNNYAIIDLLFINRM
jgi:hypothetical protein